MRGFDKAATFGFYESTLRSLIHLFKYRGMTPLAKPLSTFLEFAIPHDDHFDAVVPVPLHWKKQWSRGFNQAELLARPIAKRRNIPVLKALRRSKPTDVQASLTMAARRKNVQGAFSTRKGADLKGKKILLIDDVMTTGATAGACAMALKRAGAASVTLAVLARVDKRF